MGRLIGTLHSAGVVHGDLTTSNMLLVETKEEKDANDTTTTTTNDFSFVLYLIDFGFSKPHGTPKRNNKKHHNDIEDLAVDLYVLERALQSTHPQLPPSFWESLAQAYVQATKENNKEDNKDATKQNSPIADPHKHPVMQRLELVRQRGRKQVLWIEGDK